MGTTYPPDKWTTYQATWGTDVDREETIVTQGQYGFVFNNTTPAADPQMVSPLRPVIPRMPYRLSAMIRASSIAAGNFVSLSVNWYTSAQAFISQVSAYNAVLAAAGTMYEISGVLTAPSNAAFAKIVLGKNNAAYYAYFSAIQFDRFPRCFWAYPSANENVATGTLTVVDLDSEQYDYGSVFNTTTYRFTAPCDGVWSLSGHATWEDILNGTRAIAFLYKNGALWLNGQEAYNGANGKMTVDVIGTGLFLQRGDYVEFRTIQYTGANQDILNADYTWFTGVEILPGGIQ